MKETDNMAIRFHCRGRVIVVWLNKAFYATFEPPHDKTNKMTVRTAKTQISLGIRPVWSESLLCAQRVAKDPSFFMRTAKTLIRLRGCPGWSESLVGAHAILLVLSVLLFNLKSPTVGATGSSAGCGPPPVRNRSFLSETSRFLCFFFKVFSSKLPPACESSWWH